MIKREIVLCPVCGRKTRTVVREDTTVTNFPLFCPKCKHETLVNISKMRVIILAEPVAKEPKPQVAESIV